MKPSARPAAFGSKPSNKDTAERPREFNEGKKEMPPSYKSVSAMVAQTNRRMEKSKRGNRCQRSSGEKRRNAAGSTTRPIETGAGRSLTKGHGGVGA